MDARSTTDRERRWMEAWRAAGVELARTKREDLRSMTDEDALEATTDLLELEEVWPVDNRGRRISGLVDQQAILHGLATRSTPDVAD